MNRKKEHNVTNETN